MYPCKHEYIEALNYGLERDNVECKNCGQFWLRADRIPSDILNLRKESE